ncbi:8830_t:CDS:2 [Scutellospora calospora]|uniref:8830_t:CDS:1 n=1 Tax=Scutellospora calospora TaxID=85575 RepID=A0ACA9JXJ6_9GLOM|nr:8830_t:CDS:2 [Scutellospora calospora]
MHIASYRPVVIWHGMGDTCCNPDSMGKVQEIIKDVFPGIYTYSIMIGEDESEDKKASFFGNINEEISIVCEKLKSDENLKFGFNAIGFSQGGQFLRAYVQRCNDPPVYNLITFGSPHAGVSDIPGCGGNDVWCRIMRSIASQGAYSGYVREHIIQAQYFKDPKKLELYFERNIYLPDINNELEIKNETYKMNLITLNKLVLIRFTEDTTLKPGDTAWFSFYDEEGNVVPIREQPLYKEDWIGLRTLDKAGKIVFKDCEGPHMRIDENYFREEVVIPYLNNSLRLHKRPLLIIQHKILHPLASVASRLAGPADPATAGVFHKYFAV